ncbi:MAG: hypothetical protein D3926_21720 [Desulfobacteraceae bacterium]|nr:MAG: hypothetical protein D3926_21720 [Desulfobacteraceae bacterium]
MDPLLLSLEYTVKLVLRMGSIMFISLFGIELAMQMGMMKYLKPIGRPVSRLANLPPESAVSFLAAVGSMIAAHTMAARFYADKKLDTHQLVATGVLNTVPFHFKETLTFQIPVVLPLLGPRLCAIYIAAFWLAGIVKLIFVIVYGRLCIRPDSLAGGAGTAEADGSRAPGPPVYPECDNNNDTKCVDTSPVGRLHNAWIAKKQMFIRMIVLLAGVTFLVQLLIHSGIMATFEHLVLPFTLWLGLPPSVVGPVSTYIFSPTVGITYMSNIMHQAQVTSFEAIVALLAGSILMIPMTRLRRTLPRYISIFGLKNGSMICGTTTALSMMTRILVLLAVLALYPIYF